MSIQPDNSPQKSVQEIIVSRQEELGLTNLQIAEAMGYENQNVFSMIRSGRMRLPPQKVPVLARCLGLHSAELMRAVLLDVGPGMLEALEIAFGRPLTTDRWEALSPGGKKSSRVTRSRPGSRR